MRFGILVRSLLAASSPHRLPQRRRRRRRTPAAVLQIPQRTAKTAASASSFECYPTVTCFDRSHCGGAPVCEGDRCFCHEDTNRCLPVCITDNDCSSDGYCLDGACTPYPVAFDAPPPESGPRGRLMVGMARVPLDFPMGVSMAGYGSRIGPRTPYQDSLGGQQRLVRSSGRSRDRLVGRQGDRGAPPHPDLLEHGLHARRDRVQGAAEDRRQRPREPDHPRRTTATPSRRATGTW